MSTETNPKVEEPISSYGSLLTYADYLTMELEEMVEIIRGKLFRMSAAPNTGHQEIRWNLNFVIGGYLRNKDCKAYAAPFDVVLPVRNEKAQTATTVVQPDLCVVCDTTKLQEAGCFGPPDLIIEILSKSTTKKDLNDKYDIYQEAGVREYWIVMPLERLVEVFVLNDGKYQRVHTYYEEEVMTSSIFPDMHIDLKEVFPK